MIPNQIQCYAPDDGWGIHPKHVEQFTETKSCVTLHLVGHTLGKCLPGANLEHHLLFPTERGGQERVQLRTPPRIHNKTA